MLDVDENRLAEKYTLSEQRKRIVWGAGQFLFKSTPRPCFRLRASILKSFGAKIGTSCHIYPSAKIYFPWNLTVGDQSAIGEDTLVYNLGKVTIGSRVTISHRVHLCAGTHDYTDPAFKLLKPPIIIQSDVWVCADAFVGPGITIHEGAIVGARAAVFANVPAQVIVGGNPARLIKPRSNSVVYPHN